MTEDDRAEVDRGSCSSEIFKWLVGIEVGSHMSLTWRLVSKS